MPGHLIVPKDIDSDQLMCSCGVIRFGRRHMAGHWYSLLPQVPDTYFAVVAGRNYSVLLLMCNIYVSDRHQVSIWDVCHLLQASNIPHLKQAGVADVRRKDHADETRASDQSQIAPPGYTGFCYDA